MSSKKKKRFTATKLKEIHRLNKLLRRITTPISGPNSTYLLFAERYISSKDSTQGYGATKSQTQVNISHIPCWLSENYHDWSVEIG